MLRAAAYHGHLEIIKLLISRGADVNTSNNGETALLAAVRGAQTKVKQLLIEAGADIRAVTTDWATDTEATLEIIDHLLRNGLEIEIRADDGRTPLHEAAFYGRVELMNGLIARGAKANTKDKWQDTPLDRACLNSYIEAVKCLVSHRAQINTHSSGCEGLGRAARNGHLDLVTFLLNSGAKPPSASNAEPELLPKVVQLLLNHGSSVRGPRSLLRAVVMDSVQVVAQLLDRGKISKQEIKSSKTPLRLAILSKKIRTSDSQRCREFPQRSHQASHR